MPVNPRLCSVEWAPERVRFIWVERRVWHEHLPDEDYTRDGIEFTAHRVHRGRGLIAFDWDLVSGHAALLIQRLPSGNKYKDVKAAFHLVLEPLLKLSAFEPVHISSAILKLERSQEVVRRSMEMVTGRGGKVKFTSGRQAVDAFTDPDLNNARTALGQRLAGRHANFSWPMPADEDRKLHVKLYAPDQRLGIFGECTEQEVRHVLCRVRHHCD